MISESIMSDDVVRIRPGTKTVRDQELPDWDDPELLTISGCSMQPAGTTLDQDGRVLGISDGYNLYAPYDADIKAGDRIQYNDAIYTISGDVRVWKSPSRRLDHLVINLERWQG